MRQTVAELVRFASATLLDAGVDAPARDARGLVALALEVPADRLSLIQTELASPDAVDRLHALLERRGVERVPMSHLVGERAFFRHVFKVGPDVLDPRADTEVLVDAALQVPFQHVLDLGTGTGCILLSLLASRPAASGVGTDLSPKALAVAAKNAQALGVTERCLLLLSDWFKDVDGQFDLIVSNPPYISVAEMEELQPELTHEPRIALTDEADGLDAYRTIVPGAVTHLRPGGWLMVEIGWRQGTQILDLFARAGFTDVTLLKDWEDRDRVVRGQKPA